MRERERGCLWLTSNNTAVEVVMGGGASAEEFMSSQKRVRLKGHSVGQEAQSSLPSFLCNMSVTNFVIEGISKKTDKTGRAATCVDSRRFKLPVVKCSKKSSSNLAQPAGAVPSKVSDPKRQMLEKKRAVPERFPTCSLGDSR